MHAQSSEFVIDKTLSSSDSNPSAASNSSKPAVELISPKFMNFHARIVSVHQSFYILCGANEKSLRKNGAVLSQTQNFFNLNQAKLSTPRNIHHTHTLMCHLRVNLGSPNRRKKTFCVEGRTTLLRIFRPGKLEFYNHVTR